MHQAKRSTKTEGPIEYRFVTITPFPPPPPSILSSLFSSTTTTISTKNNHMKSMTVITDHNFEPLDTSSLPLPSSNQWSGQLIARILPINCKSHREGEISPFRLEKAKMDHLLATVAFANNDTHATNDAHTNGDCFTEDFGNGDNDDGGRTSREKICVDSYPPDKLYISLDLCLYGPQRHDRAQSPAAATVPTKQSTEVEVEVAPQSITANRTELRFHLNRSSEESVQATLRRLELSTYKKILSLSMSGVSGGSGGRGKQPRTKQHKKGMNGANNKTQMKRNNDANTEVASFFLSSNPTGEPTRIDTKDVCAVQVWKAIAHMNNQVTLSLFHPNNNNNNNNNNTPTAVLTVHSCPPTILSVRTFANFESRLYVGVPIVVESDVLFASRTVVSWFVNGTLVLRDCGCFVPGVEHVGGEVEVLLQPVRDDWDQEEKEEGGGFGSGGICAEAYRFRYRVENLPYDSFADRKAHLKEGGGGGWNINHNWDWDRTTTSSPTSCASCTHIQDNKNNNDNESTILRVMTYNILADFYASRETEHHRMSSHCSPAHLHKNRRMPIVLAEILMFRADIICLQEVDASIFETLFEPCLRYVGYDGYYSNKASETQREGCAMFWKRDVLEVQGEGEDDDNRETYALRDLFESNGRRFSSRTPTEDKGEDRDPCMGGERQRRCKSDDWTSMDTIHNLLCGHDELRGVVTEKLGQILQVVVLRTKRRLRTEENLNHTMDHSDDDEGYSLGAGRTFVVANTHLFYHPMADHIRALQTYVVCRKIDELRRRTGIIDCGDDGRTNTGSNTDMPQRVPLVLCGDLNSDPESGALHLLLNRLVRPDHHDCWKYLHEFGWEMENDGCRDEEVMGIRDARESESAVFTTQTRTLSSTATTYSSSSSSLVQLPSPGTISLPASFPKLVSGCLETPDFTNYALGYVQTLDYVLVSKPSITDLYGFVPWSSAPMPLKETVKRYIAMPNKFMPSDHVSVVCDLEWVMYQ